ncbi:hypothetical protein [Bradyrhizobium yuanmingense]|uniref:hypothetical protein n=1 Tax=Bradyrhizobium yuanmingense TaxID=108015 RepID=UPI003514F8B3
MSYAATVFHVLIASPSDVPEEREAIAQSLHDWNGLHSFTTKTVLLPVMWESHSAPSMGSRPQEIINKQLVRSCDMLIGAFWTRLGSHTGVEESGTVEEIKWFLKQDKPVMLYFSRAPLDPGRVDTKQLDRLNSFKAEIRGKGLQDDYESVADLKQKLARHLTIVMREISVETTVDIGALRRANVSTPDSIGEAHPVGKSDAIVLCDYTDKSFVVVGNTVKFKDDLKAAGGKWISARNGTKCWNFSKKRLSEVAKLLGVDASLRALEG